MQQNEGDAPNNERGSAHCKKEGDQSQTKEAAICSQWSACAIHSEADKGGNAGNDERNDETRRGEAARFSVLYGQEADHQHEQRHGGEKGCGDVD